MKTINITDKDPLQQARIFTTILIMITPIWAKVFTYNVEAVEIVGETEVVEVQEDTKEVFASVRSVPEVAEYNEPELEKIRAVYAKYATEKMMYNIDWLYGECERRGLEPSLVFAVQAWESGWGKSAYCINDNNCFGFGYTDSGKVGNWDGGNYRDITALILDKYVEQGYGVESASVMASRGYNFHQSWIDNVNLIESYFSR